jgi:hypothetical protein
MFFSGVKNMSLIVLSSFIFWRAFNNKKTQSPKGERVFENKKINRYLSPAGARIGTFPNGFLRGCRAGHWASSLAAALDKSHIQF